jgi:hypothetical protein
MLALRSFSEGGSEVEWVRIQFFALDPRFRRGDIVDFRFP